MRTNIDIDDTLMKQAMKASETKTKTKRAVVQEALQMLVRIRAQEAMRDLFGKAEFVDGYNYKAMRLGSPERLAGKIKPASGPSRGAPKRTSGARRQAA